MRIKRAIVPALLALSTAGSILAGSALPLVATQASSAQVVAGAVTPYTVYHW